ncbi:MAG: hypothetical protein PF503_19005 [Desulfobacula sp.]|jgi:hypothetical protein|nr:hypothetical protein [Desulfobacula sp.]
MKIKTKLYASAFISIGLLSALFLLLLFFSQKVSMEREKEILAHKFEATASSVIVLAYKYTERQSERTVILLNKKMKLIEEIIKQAEGQISLQIIHNAFESLENSYSECKYSG